MVKNLLCPEDQIFSHILIPPWWCDAQSRYKAALGAASCSREVCSGLCVCSDKHSMWTPEEVFEDMMAGGHHAEVRLRQVFTHTDRMNGEARDWRDVQDRSTSLRSHTWFQLQVFCVTAVLIAQLIRTHFDKLKINPWCEHFSKDWHSEWKESPVSALCYRSVYITLTFSALFLAPFLEIDIL